MENSYNTTEGQDTQEHLPDDLEYTYTQADSGKRFGNYLVDRVVFYFAWWCFSSIAARPLAFILVSTTRERNIMRVEAYFMVLVAFVVFFTAFEGFSKGKTPVKWITGTRVVTADGRHLAPVFREAGCWVNAVR